MNGTLEKTMELLKVEEPVSYGPLRLFPLTGGPSAEEGIALLDEALDTGALRVEELDEGGSVPELKVTNQGSVPVLVLEGDELIGAKQNRIVNSSVLVAAESELVLPVSCVERGRWSYRSRAFSSGDGRPHPSLRGLKSRSVHDSLRRGRGHRSDQGAVWDEVERVAHLHEAPSPTDALQDTRTHLSDRIAAFTALADGIPESARGVAVAVGGRVTVVEVLAGPRSLKKVLRKLLSGYALEALAATPKDGTANSASVEGVVRAMAQAHPEEHQAVGSGRDLRFETEGLSGYALADRENVLHAAAFAD